jgi:ABC-type glycerol-3-phosphate transport system permease component
MRESIAERITRRAILAILTVFAIFPMAVLVDDSLRSEASVRASPVYWESSTSAECVVPR